MSKRSRRKSKPAAVQERSYDGGWLDGFSAHAVSGVDINQATALTATTVLAAVTMLCEDFAKLTPTIYRRNPDGSRAVANDHELYPLLYTPNDWQTYFEWAEMMQLSLVLRGNAYSVRIRDGRGNTIKLIPVNADWVGLWESPDGGIYYRITPNGLHLMHELWGQPFLIPAEDMLHVKGFSLNGLLGASRIAMAKEAIGLALGYERQAAQYMSQGASASGVLTTDQKLTPEAAKRMGQDWKDRKSGLQNAGKIVVLEQGLKYQPTTLTAADAQYIAARNLQIQEVTRIFRIPAHMLGDLARCMPASTLVYTAGGPKKIVDVKCGEFVWSCGEGGVALSRVIGCYDNGEDEILEISTTNRTIRCNAAHRILARREHHIPVEKGRRGGKNVGGKKVNVEWRTEYVAAGDLRPGDTVVALKCIRDMGGDTAPNGRLLTIGFMEFCGLLLGDGNVTKANGKYVGVQIARADTALYMSHYKVIARSEFSSGGTLPVHGERHGMAKLTACQVDEIRNSESGFGKNIALGARFGVSPATIKAARSGRKWSAPEPSAVRPILFVESGRSSVFKSVTAAAELVELGFAGTAFTKTVPEWVYGLREDLRLAFVRGFLDADGTVNKLGRVCFDSANRFLLDGIRHLCMGLDIPVTNVQTVDQTTLPPCAKALVHTRMYRFTCSDPGANARIGSNDPRYVERMSAGKPFGRKGRSYPRHGGKGFDLNGTELSAVSSIKKLPKERVFDLEVDGTHCFIADGVIVHNSTNNNITQQSQEYINLTMSSYTSRWAWKLDVDFGLRAQSLFVDYDLTQLSRGDQTQRYNNYARGISGMFLTPNEARLDDGRDPKPGGDQLFKPMNMSPEASSSSGAGAEGGGRPEDGSADQKL